MRISMLAVLALCAACGSSMTYAPPPGGGGGDGGVTSGDAPNATDGPGKADALPGTPGDGPTLSGRVCLANDPRDLRTCAATGAGGLLVQLGDAAAVTTDDGSFTIAGSFGPGMEWHVTGSSIVTSIMQLPDYQIPAITTATYASMLTANNAALQPGQGTLMVTLVQNGVSPVGSTATVTPGFFDPYYDTASTTTWAQSGGVGSGGTVWVPGLDVGNATLTAKLVGTTMTTSTPPQPIEDHAITYDVITFP